ncbi:Right handed beta helix region [Opitutus sp. GAS368]|nr:Right handed beta helix region [Opitutus sp. GAS368]
MPRSADAVCDSFTTARELVRQWRKAGGIGPVEVYVHTGTYYLTETVVLGPEDSGTADAPVVYRAEKPGTVRLIGGTKLTPTQAHWDRGDLLTFRLPPEPVATNGLASESRLGRSRPSFEVFWNGRRLPLARWPNLVGTDRPDDGWAYVEAVPKTATTDRFTVHGLPTGLAVTGAEIRVFSQPEWYDQMVPVAGYDTTTGELHLASPTSYPLVPGTRFYLQNARAALDQPGEWWFDPQTRELLVLAPESSEHGSEIFISRLATMLHLKGVSRVGFSGFVWEGATGDAIRLEDVSDCTFTDNQVALAAGWGIVAKTDGQLLINRNIVRDTGLGGMKLSGGDKTALKPAQTIVRDNELRNFGQLLACYLPALYLDGVGLVVEHNHISHAPHSAVTFTGNNHRILANLIEDVCRETNDAGAIYAGRNWADRGTHIERNVFRNIVGWHFLPSNSVNSQLPPAKRYVPGGLAPAVYLDDMLENSFIRDNVFDDIETTGILLGGGSYHTVIGNFFSHMQTGLLVDAQGSYQTSLDHLRPFLKEGSPYYAAYPEIRDREAHDPLTPSQLGIEDNHFIDVLLPYDIRLLGAQNIFSGNHFAGLSPAVKAVLKQAQIRKPLNSWAEWQAAGFDVDAVLESKLSSKAQKKMDKIINEAGPRKVKTVTP